MIKFDHVTKTYPKEVVALHDIDFSIADGEFISIVGRSGAGKSTLLKLLIREDKPTYGSIIIDDIDISTIQTKDLSYLRRKIGVVFQDIKLLPTRTAFENVSFAMEVGGATNDEIKNEVPKILDLVGLVSRSDAFPTQLSGGEQQRIAIARALAHRPVLFLADEPTGNLDEINAMEILETLRKINELGTTVILATHARELVNRVKKRVIVIEKGEIASDIPQGKYKL
ncbi:MAG: cell division ATP-binding protein FtsE [bacterium]|nr:cell division ATP-binding protein FtsE [bacterium]